MKKHFKPNTWLYPQPVLVIASYGADGTADGMVAAWGGIYDTNQVGFMLDHTHKTVANLDVRNLYPSQVSMVSRTSRDAGYFMGPVKSDLASWYQVNPGDLKIEDLDAYQVAWDLSGLPVGTKVYTVGSVLSSAGGGLMNFRTAQGNIILVNLNGAVVPMGQRVTVLGIVSNPSVLTVQFMNSVAS